MSQSCLPVNAKMSKAKKVLDEARETQNRELDLVDKGISSFEELPGLCKCKQKKCKATENVEATNNNYGKIEYRVNSTHWLSNCVGHTHFTKQPNT